MIYPKNSVFIGCFEPLPIAGVAKYVDASSDAICGFRWAISSLTKEVIRQMYAKRYVATMWSDVEEPQQSPCLSCGGLRALKCSPRSVLSSRASLSDVPLVTGVFIARYDE